MSARPTTLVLVPGAATIRRLPPRGTAGPLLLALLAAVAVGVSHLLDFGLDGLRAGLLNADSAGSWSHLAVDAILVSLTVVALAGAMRDRPARRLWWVIAATLAFLAADEVSPLHAQVDQLSWGKLVYVPALVVLFACLWRLTGRRTDRARRPAPGRALSPAGDRIGDRALLVRIGLGTLVLSYAVHVLGPHVVQALGWGTGSWAYQVKVALKQATELAGWLLVAIGLARLSLSR